MNKSVRPFEEEFDIYNIPAFKRENQRPEFRNIYEGKDFFPNERKYDDILKNMLLSGNEVEVSFGFFDKNNSFHPNVYPEEVGRLRTFLEKSGIKSRYTYTLEYRKGEERLIFNSRTDKNPKLERKKKIGVLDIPHWGYRISESTEDDIKSIEKSTVSEFNYDILREKNRTSFQTSDTKDILYGVRIDMTSVISEKDGKTISGFEIEIERTDSQNVEKFIKAVNFIYLILQGGYNIISSKERFAIQRRFNSLFLSDYKKRNINEPYNRFYTGFENKPRGLKLEDLLKDKRYFLTDKLDGVRKFLFIDDRAIYLINPPNGMIKLSNVSIQGLSNSLLDGEYIDNIINNKENSFHGFDVLFFKGKDVRELSFSQRLNSLKSITIPNNIIKFYVKEFFYNNDFYKSVNETLKYIEKQSSSGYKNDGLILQPDDPYAKTETKGKSTTLKWKPFEFLTIDFLFKATDSLNSFIPTVMGRNNELIPFKGSCNIPYDGTITVKHTSASKSGNALFEGYPVENAILECYWNTTKKEFKPLRFRNDKFNPQFVDFAVDIWEDIHNPIPLSTMKGNSLQLLRKEHNKFKMNMLSKNVEKESTIIDIGSGQGGDLNKWRELSLKVYSIEPWKENASEYIRRLDCMRQEGNAPDIKKLLEVGAEDTEYLKKEINAQVDTIISFFSLTFFFKNENMLDKLVETISTFLKQGGKFIGALFDGDRVKSLLKENKGIAKYESFSLEALNKKILDSEYSFGQEIIIDINDTTSRVKNQKEYLTNFNILVEKLKSVGIELLNDFYLTDLPPIIPKESVIFSSLNRAFIFERKTLRKNKSPREIEIEVSSVPKIKEKRYEAPSMLPTDEIKKYKIPIINDLGYETVRIGTIGEGSCLFHAILRSFSPSYQKMSNSERREYVAKLREGFASGLSLEDLKKMGGGETFKYLRDRYTERIKERGVKEERVEYIILGIYRKALRNCSSWIGNKVLPLESVVEYISGVLNIDIFFIASTTRDVVKTNQKLKKTKAVIILNIDNSHFESVGISVNETVYTYFTWNSKIIQMISKRSLL